MIPQLVTVGYRGSRGRWRRLYVPVVPVVVVLSPLLLLAAAAGLVMCRVYGISPAGALCGAGRLVWALPGARFELDDGQFGLRMSIR